MNVVRQETIENTNPQFANRKFRLQLGDRIKFVTNPIIGKARRIVRQIFEQQQRLILDLLRNIKKQQLFTDVFDESQFLDISLDQQEEQDRWTLMDTIMLTSILSGTAEGIDILGALAPDGLSLNDAAANKFIQERLFQLADQTTQTTNKALRKTLSRISRDKLTVEEGTQQLSKIFDFTIATRATQIAQNEISRANNFGLKDTYRQSGVVLKEWVTQRDERVCPFCQAMDGTIVGMESSFLFVGEQFFGVDGSQMIQGYTSAENGNLHVSCRCFIVPVIRPV